MSEIKTYIDELHDRISEIQSKIEKNKSKYRDQQLAFEHKINQLHSKAESETIDYKGKKLEFSYKKTFDKIAVTVSDEDILNELKKTYKI